MKHNHPTPPAAAGSHEAAGRPLSCRAALRAANRRLDERLPAEAAGALEAHLQSCPACDGQVAAIERSVRALRDSGAAAASAAGVPAGFDERLRAHLRDVAASEPLSALIRLRSAATPRLVASLAAGLLVVVATGLAFLAVEGAPAATASGALGLPVDAVDELVALFAAPDRVRSLIVDADHECEALLGRQQECEAAIHTILASGDGTTAPVDAGRDDHITTRQLLGLIEVLGISCTAGATPPNPGIWQLGEGEWPTLWATLCRWVDAQRQREEVVRDTCRSIRAVPLAAPRADAPAPGRSGLAGPWQGNGAARIDQLLPH